MCAGINKARIVEAALFTAFKKGMGETSLADIAQSLSIKKASLYNYFSGKEEILSAVYTFCADFYARINFIEQEIFSKINSTNAEGLFKKAVERYVQNHEAEPLFQIYSLVASEKYFNKECLDLYLEQKEKLQSQAFLFFKINSAQTQGSGQKPDDQLQKAAENFSSGFLMHLDLYIAQKKETIRHNPECDAGSLFALPSDKKGINKITEFAIEILRSVV